MTTLDKLLTTEEVPKKGVKFSFTTFKLIIKQNVPQQMNLTDCGVYVIKFMLLRDTILERNLKVCFFVIKRYVRNSVVQFCFHTTNLRSH